VENKVSENSLIANKSTIENNENFENIKIGDKTEVKIPTENSLIANKSTIENNENFENIKTGDKTVVKIPTENYLIANESTIENNENFENINIGEKTEVKIPTENCLIANKSTIENNENFENIKIGDKTVVKILTENSLIANKSTIENNENFENIKTGDKTEVKIPTENSLIANKGTMVNKKDIGDKSEIIKKFIKNHILQQNVNFLSTFEIFMNVNNISYLDVKRAIEETSENTNIFQILSLIFKYFVGCLKVGNDYSALFNHAQFRNPKSHFYCFDVTTLIIYVFEEYELMPRTWYYF
jgi:hypothetical protein